MPDAGLSYHAAVSKFSTLTVLVAGDFMLDRFIHGKVHLSLVVAGHSTTGTLGKIASLG